MASPQVASRQFPVTVHFNKHTPHMDHYKEAYKKVCKIHERLPDGGILVFVTSQQEIGWLCRKLGSRYSAKKSGPKGKSMCLIVYVNWYLCAFIALACVVMRMVLAVNSRGRFGLFVDIELQTRKVAGVGSSCEEFSNSNACCCLINLMSIAPRVRCRAVI